jgi:hypothetical protein
MTNHDMGVGQDRADFLEHERHTAYDDWCGERWLLRWEAESSVAWSAAPLAGDVEHGTGRCGGPPCWSAMQCGRAAASTTEGVGARQHRRLLKSVCLHLTMIVCADEPTVGRGGPRVEGTRVVTVGAEGVMWWSVLMGIRGGDDGGMCGRAVSRGECRRHVGGQRRRLREWW